MTKSKRSPNERPTLSQDRINRAWSKFKAAGMLWFVNRLLHFFGWAIVFRYDDKTGKLLGVEPNRCRFRGFSSEVEDAGYRNVTEWMAKSSKELLEDINTCSEQVKRQGKKWLRLP